MVKDKKEVKQSIGESVQYCRHCGAIRFMREYKVSSRYTFICESCDNEYDELDILMVNKLLPD